MRLDLGINTCFAVKRWPRPEDWAPIVRDRLGLRLVQHSLDLVEPPLGERSVVAAAAPVRAAADTFGLRIHSTFTGLAAYSANLLLHPDPDARSAARIRLHRAIAFTARVGGLATGGHVGAFSVSDWADPHRRRKRWAELRSELATLAGDARRTGLAYLVIENLAAAREPSTMAMVRELLDEGDPGRVPVRLCLDVGHMCVPGTEGADRDPYAWLRELGTSSPIVQLQQSDDEGDHHWPFTPERNAIGRIDADRVIDALGEGGVEASVLVLEVIPPFEQADEEVVGDLQASVDYWRDALDRRGVLAAS
ncbi:MAG TPA: sugar phosphate isomerase/epimerase [Candidatus Limnocylindrales bacterium]